MFSARTGMDVEKAWPILPWTQAQGPVMSNLAMVMAGFKNNGF